MSNVNFLPNTPDPIEPKEGRVRFEPHWRVKIGPVTEEGRGILTKSAFKNFDLIDEFSLLFPGLTAKLDLKTGDLWFLPYTAEPQLIYRPDFPPGTKFKLIWFRRMRKEFGTHDKNTGAFEAAFYGFGWQAQVNGKTIKYGYRLIEEAGKPDEAEFIKGLP